MQIYANRSRTARPTEPATSTLTARPHGPQQTGQNFRNRPARVSGASNLTEVVLGELAGQPFEAHLQANVLRTQRGDELAGGALATLVAPVAGAAQDLKRHQVRLLLQKLGHEVATMALSCWDGRRGA